jgi:2-succinyl-6-hydroxy-2,4-cyclohexadiene-1-carboxylate synthase
MGDMMPLMRLHVTHEGSGPRVVLVHGFTQTGRSWDRIAADLARDHEVVRVDAPGHGGSAGVRADLWEGASLLAEAGGPAVYVGYSMGGRLVLHLALRHPDVVSGLAVLGATGGLDEAAERAARRASDEVLAEELERDGVEAFLDRWLAQPLFAGVPPDPVERAARSTNTVAGLASSLRLAGTGTQDPPLWSRLTELRARAVPALLLAGERDAKFTALAQRLAADIGPTATWASIPGAGHAAHLEQPEAFLAALRAWLPRAEHAEPVV